MGQEFFVAFKAAVEENELVNIVYKMNSINNTYHAREEAAGGSGWARENDVLSVMHGVLGKRKGFFVRKLRDSECYGILWRKYFALSHNDDYGVFFYDEEYEQRLAAESKKVGAVKVAFA